MKEISLIGGFYRSKTLPWSAQDVVNWAPVPSRSGGTRSPLKLRGLPGLKPFTLSPVLPAGVFLTTPTYPIEVIEGLNLFGAVTSGVALAAYIEGFDITAGVTGGELRSTLQAYTMQPEGFDISASVTGGEIRTLLISTTMQPEGFDITAAVIGGEIRTLLISNTMQPEGFDISATVTGGTLT